MVGHGGSSAGSYLADPTSPIPSHCASIVATSTVRVNERPLRNILYRNSKNVQSINLDHRKRDILEWPGKAINTNSCYSIIGSFGARGQQWLRSLVTGLIVPAQCW